jgi:hypothetical protein
MNKIEDETRVDRLKRSAFDHPLVAIIIIATASIIAAGQLADAYNTLLVSTGLKSDALDLASQSTRGEFSRQLTDVAWRRLYWSNSYTGRIKRNAPSSDIDESWRQYSLTMADWNAQLVTMRRFFEEYYSARHGEAFNSIHTQFTAIHADLVFLRYEDTVSTPAQRKQRADSIQRQINEVNLDLCLLVTGLEKGHTKANESCMTDIK